MSDCISKKINFFKWILTLGIVLYHSKWIGNTNVVFSSFWDRKLFYAYEKFANHIGFVCMVFFFFISGFFLYNNVNCLKDIFIKMKKRIKTLLIPFILWNFIIVLYNCIIGSVSLSFYNICDFFFFKPLAGPLWYLLALLLLMIISPIFTFFKKHKIINTLLFAVVFSLSILVIFNIIELPFNFIRWWWGGNIIYYLPVYLIGSYIGLYYPKLILNNSYTAKKYYIIGFILVLFSIFLWLAFDLHSNYFIYSIIELIGFWFLLPPNLFESKVPSYYACSFYIYALHNPVFIPIVYNNLLPILKKMEINGIEIVFIKIIILLLVVIFSYITYLLAQKIFSKKVCTYLTGGR